MPRNHSKVRAGRFGNKGFTLIEVMVVVVVVALLATIAITSYMSYTIRAKRSAAESFLMSVANKQEQYVLDSRQYANSLAALNMTVPADVDAGYNITITNVGTAPPTYTINAVPKDAQAVNDTQCATVSINQAGAKSQTGGGTVNDCW